MIRVLEFSHTINRHDFIDAIIHYADPERFEMSACVRTEEPLNAAPHFRPGTRYQVIPGLSKFNIPLTAVRLARLLREWEIDILHAHHYDQGLIAWLATRIHRRTRLVIGRHYSDSIYRLNSRWKQRIYLGAESLVNRAAERIIIPSTYIREILERRQKVDPAKLDLIPYGFVAKKYDPPLPAVVDGLREEFAMDGRFVVATFSRLHEEKGHRYLVEAAAIARRSIPELLVLCIGDGPERPAIQRQIEERGVGINVKLIGWRPDAMAVASAVDAVVQSTLQEAFSQVMVEALWMSKPLVITDVSGAADIIRDGENGLLVPKADAQALADAMLRLARDPSLGKRLGAAGHELVSRELVIEKKITDYERSFLRAMNGSEMDG
jgi:glycosyltransferase involved in cell wall biosynthesis